MWPVVGSESLTWISAESTSCSSWNASLKYQLTGNSAWWIEPFVTSIASIPPSWVKGSPAPPVETEQHQLPPLLIQSYT